MSENKQTQILSYIHEKQQQQGYAPTIREIAKHVNLASSATVQGHVNRLIKKGYLSRQQTKSRSLKLTQAGIDSLNQTIDVNYIPLLDENERTETTTVVPPDFLPFPKQILDNPSELFMIHQTNQTMIDIGIYPEDVLIVRHQATANNGDIVVVDLPDVPQQVYRFFDEHDQYRFQPENTRLPSISLKEANIKGKVISLYRSQVK